MNEQITKNWFKIFLILIIGLAFYWYEWRPTQIKKECYNIAWHKAYPCGDNSKSVYEQNSYNNYYKSCLEQKGL